MTKHSQPTKDNRAYVGVDQYAVIGNPIGHSKSPEIHTCFAKQSKQDIHYSKIKVARDNFHGFVTEFFAQGGRGLNVTVPFKEQAFAICSHCSKRGALAKAINTLYLNERGEICGDNTDGVGIINDIESNHGIQIADSRLLILGAGGAVRGILAGLADRPPGFAARSITLSNRTVSKAEKLQQEFVEQLPIECKDLQSLDSPFDLVINGTSMGLDDEVPDLNPAIVCASSCCYDMVYNNQGTAFTRWAQQHGCAVVLDGLGMLVEQAAESFRLWRSIKPDTKPVIAMLRNTA